VTGFSAKADEASMTLRNNTFFMMTRSMKLPEHDVNNRKCKRPDRLAIRASCVTIARQPPWSLEALTPSSSQTSSPNLRQAGCRRGNG
jgi:hypothetical protein